MNSFVFSFSGSGYMARCRLRIRNVADYAHGLSASPAFLGRGRIGSPMFLRFS